MRKVLFLVTLGLFLLAVSQINFAVAEHSHEHMCEELETGADFGEHVSTHAQLSHLGAEMNPGMHKGYSVCLDLEE